jgi:hypothetical protein
VRGLGARDKAGRVLRRCHAHPARSSSASR